jgi:hypothetical protein
MIMPFRGHFIKSDMGMVIISVYMVPAAYITGPWGGWGCPVDGGGAAKALAGHIQSKYMITPSMGCCIKSDMGMVILNVYMVPVVYIKG